MKISHECGSNKIRNGNFFPNILPMNLVVD